MAFILFQILDVIQDIGCTREKTEQNKSHYGFYKERQVEHILGEYQGSKNKKVLDPLLNAQTLYDAALLYARKIRMLLKRDDKIVGLCGTGWSGAIIAAAIMVRKMPRALDNIYIRKSGERSHSTGSQGITKSQGKYIFVDDFICSGDTLTNVMQAMASMNLEVLYAVVYGHPRRAMGGLSKQQIISVNNVERI